MKNFIQRAITGLIFVAVLIGCMIGGPISFGGKGFKDLSEVIDRQSNGANGGSDENN